MLATLGGCNQKKEKATPSSTTVPPAAAPLAHQLALARLDAAKTCLENNAQDQALALLVSALKAEPASPAAAALIHQLLAKTVWSVTSATITQPLPVEHLAFAPPSSLWVSLAESAADGFNTTVLWNTDALKLESVLFPARGAATRSLVLGQNQHSLVVQRGSGASAVTLLCDAKTLRPVRALGSPPAELTPQSVIVSSANGLLIAYPEAASATDPQIIWRICDAATGEMIRSSDPVADESLRPLAAHLDSRRLRVLHADGSLLDLPVSPVEPAAKHVSAVPLVFLHAQFSPNGAGFIALLDRGPDQAPVRRF